MHLIVNGERVDSSATMLTELITELGYDTAPVATAVNGGFVSLAARGSVHLAAEDRIEIVAPRQGG